MISSEARTYLGKWASITKSIKDADTKLNDLLSLLLAAANQEAPLDSEDISIIVYGSLARGEWTSGSDLDWTMLIDGQVDQAHYRTAQKFRSLLKSGGFKDPGPTGTFGSMVFSHGLVHQIGGEDDTNRNTTRRMLLLLESVPVRKDEAYDRVIRQVIERYLDHDFPTFRLKVPRFLLNDVHRFWRTMCVDYASKYRERAADKWALRNIKLRMSRKLIFATGLLTCFSCDSSLLRGAEPELIAAPSMAGLADYLERQVRQAPLEVLFRILQRVNNSNLESELLDPYDRFLSMLDDKATREHLEGLGPEDADRDSKFIEAQQLCKQFGAGLESLFFDFPDLSPLSRRYGVF